MSANHARRATLAIVVLFVSCSDGTGPEPNAALGRRLMVSEQATCALDATGAVFCWGVNSDFFEFGAAPNARPGSVVPVAVPIPKLVSLASGRGSHLCGIKFSQEALCWGRGTFGQLGHGSLGAVGNPPVTVEGPIYWNDLSVGRITTCGRADNGTGYCWGINQSGEVGAANVPLNTNSVTPVAVDGGFSFKQIVAGWLHACGIATTGEAYCWGNNRHGQLGLGATDTLGHRTPQPVTGGLSFVQIALGSRYTCGVATDSAAYCWGTNGVGQLGDGTTIERAAPTRVAGNFKFRQIAAGSGFGTSSSAAFPVSLQGGVGHTCALTGSGVAYCWGWNGDGQLGENTFTDRSSPVAVSGNLTLEAIALGSASTCGMRRNAVWCWGSNASGQLGTGFTGSSPTPIPVAAPFNRP